MQASFTQIKPMIFVIFCIFFLSHSKAQNGNNEIIKHYTSIDTVKANKDVHLILYKDNTFFNYGIFVNKKENDTYIWFSTGTYKSENNQLILKSFVTAKNKESLIKDIKYAYKRRPDHLLIDNYYEYVYEKLNDATFDINENTLYYKIKDISLYERK